MILKLGMKHLGIELYKVVNHNSIKFSHSHREYKVNDKIKMNQLVKTKTKNT